MNVPTFEKSAYSGVVFRDSGRLCVFEHTSVTVLQAWPPMAWKKTQARPFWSPCRPDISVPRGPLDGAIRACENRVARLLHSSGDEEPDELARRRIRMTRERRAWLMWFNQMPRPDRDRVSRFRDRQFHVLSMLARCGSVAHDLVHTNPALAFALASCWVFRPRRVQWTMRSIRAQLRAGRRQRDIAEWLGFPGTEQARRVLSAIEPGAVAVSRLLYLRTALLDPGCVRALAAVPRINAGVLRIATDPRRLALVSPELLQEVSVSPHEERRSPAATALGLLLRQQRANGAGPRQRARVRSLTQLLMMVGDHGAGRGVVPVRSDVQLPAPPVTGTDAITPLQTAAELVAEGRRQHHCVATYLTRVAVRGSHYVYRVDRPERCTLSLVSTAGGWRIGELRAAWNRPVSPETWTAVTEWLRGAGEAP